MYSEQGLDARIRLCFLQVCQRFIVVSNCIPGSPQTWHASAIRRSSARASSISAWSPSVRRTVAQVSSCSHARMNPSGTRTELFAFWKETDAYASPLNEPS